MFSLFRCLLLLSPSIFVACTVEFQVDVLAPEDFSVSNLPLRGLTIRCSCVCCSCLQRNGLRFTTLFCRLQTMKRQLFKSALVINVNSKLLSVECCLETKMRRDVNLLYDVMADTIGYIQVKMRAASWQLAKTHAQFTHCERASRATRL